MKTSLFHFCFVLISSFKQTIKFPTWSHLVSCCSLSLFVAFVCVVKHCKCLSDLAQLVSHNKILVTDPWMSVMIHMCVCFFNPKETIQICSHKNCFQKSTTHHPMSQWFLVLLDFFFSELSLERDWWGLRSQEVWEEGNIPNAMLSPHHKNDVALRCAAMRATLMFQ